MEKVPLEGIERWMRITIWENRKVDGGGGTEVEKENMRFQGSDKKGGSEGTK